MALAPQPLNWHGAPFGVSLTMLNHRQIERDWRLATARLNSDERLQLAQLTHPARMLGFVAGRLLARAARSDGFAAISLSHGLECTVCAAAAAGPLGIDIQPIETADMLGETVYSARERELLATIEASDRPIAATLSWVVKEAIAKRDHAQPATALATINTASLLECVANHRPTERRVFRWPAGACHAGRSGTMAIAVAGRFDGAASYNQVGVTCA